MKEDTWEEDSYWNGDANKEGTAAYGEKQRLWGETCLWIDNPCDDGATTLRVPLLKDCTCCHGRSKKGFQPDSHILDCWDCENCTNGLVPNESGKAVLNLMKHFLKIGTKLELND